MSRKRWREAGSLVMRWKNVKNVMQMSLPFDWERICSHLVDRETFEPAEFNFPPLISGWLDASLEVMKPFHAPANEKLDEALTFMFPLPISAHFPIVPLLDREGRAFSSLQLMLLKSWLELRTRLVTNSANMFESYEWLRDLFMYLNTVVSAVDNTLHQIYYRAKYEAHAHGWSFNEEALGLPHARRIRDKFRWLGQITGRPLEGCTQELDHFVALKDVRNHIAHFDPPTFVYSIEDVAQWLNASTSVAKLLAATRRHISEPLCVPLVSLLLARPVDWYPSDPGRRRVPQSKHVGYASSCWPKQ